ATIDRSLRVLALNGFAVERVDRSLGIIETAWQPTAESYGTSSQTGNSRAVLRRALVTIAPAPSGPAVSSVAVKIRQTACGAPQALLAGDAQRGDCIDMDGLIGADQEMIDRIGMEIDGSTGLPTPPTAISVEQAQPSTTLPSSAQKSRLLLGFGLGAAELTCEDCASKGGFEAQAHVGRLLDRRTALLYDVGMWTGSDDYVSVTLLTHTLAAQYWLAPGVWMRGGAGLAMAQASINWDSSGYQYGFAAVGALGVAMAHSDSASLDLSLRLSLIHFEGTGAMLGALLGFQFK
ncbi:MAG TPA: hypothetical protein VL172_10985, partial [Kofleriaceae bacterium]|nr:hypothetical protein [Kofleriaceae bacterium]